MLFNLNLVERTSLADPGVYYFKYNTVFEMLEYVIGLVNWYVYWYGFEEHSWNLCLRAICQYQWYSNNIVKQNTYVRSSSAWAASNGNK